MNPAINDIRFKKRVFISILFHFLHIIAERILMITTSARMIPTAI